MTGSADSALRAALRALSARKALRLVVLELGERAYFTDHFVICHGTSDRQVKTLAEAVIGQVKEASGKKPSVEGLANGEWVLLDYGDFVVHIFNESAREFYRLESLWFDANEVDPDSLAAEAAG